MVRTHTLLSLAFVGLQGCQSPHESAAPPASEPATSTAAVDIRPSNRPKTDLASAIAAAQASEPGASFLGAEFLHEDDQPLFRVLLVDKGVVHAIEVDAADGKLMRAQDEELDEESMAMLDEIRKESATFGIDKAIAAALEQLPLSWASWAGPAHDGARGCYGVVVVNETTTKYVLVSAQDGKVLSVRDPEEEAEGDEHMEQEAAEAKPK